MIGFTDIFDDMPAVHGGCMNDEVLAKASARVEPAVARDAPAMPDLRNLLEGEPYCLSGNFMP